MTVTVARIARNGRFRKGNRMAHFYGNLKGSRGEATRCGTRQSGIRVSARSWAGSVSVEMQGREDGTPGVIIRCSDTSSTGGRVVYVGPLASLVNAASLVAKGSKV